MTENWDFYFLHVDGKPASIFVDLGATALAPSPHLPFMAYLRLYMNAAREDGLSSQEEFDALSVIEDSLETTLISEEIAYVGRCTTNSCRDFFFYIAQPDDWDKKVGVCMQPFSGYRYETGAQKDQDWATYYSYLYPSAANRQTIENRRVCTALEKHGDKLESVREIDHWAYFQNHQTLSSYVDEALRLGFAVRQLSPPSSDDPRHCARLWRADVPGYGTIDEVTFPLFDLAIKHNGEYDGWETFIVA